ncbi:hypothetical protein BDD41_4283 [Paracoccus versutus]|uniref:Uncharacterized protein n=1 Tax=Paracoccus versutus TaxID=34007 RepID=A0A3D9XC43_PARVE|nr:hypothetical protein BDD41_4283 [Paracoccus versutus]
MAARSSFICSPGLRAAWPAPGFKLSPGWIFLSYSLGGVAFVMAAALVLSFARSVRRSTAIAMARNRHGYRPEE